MFFGIVHPKPRTDRMTAWLLLTQARMPLTVPHPAGVPHDPQYRWKRSLRAPMLFQSLSGLLSRNVSVLRPGSLA